MRAIILDRPSEDFDALRVGEMPRPQAGPGEVLVAVAYCGCNYADTMMRKGTYPHPKGYPLVAGSELSGIVAAVGPGVDGFAVGDRVAGFVENAASFADYCVAPVERLVIVPAAIDLKVAAAFFVQSLTAWHLLHNVSKVQPGDTVLIHAIGGGVGLYLTQLAAMAGATVLGTVGTAGKEQRALDYGASFVVNRDEKDFVEAVLAFTDGRPIDKLYDSTGGSILDRSFALMRRLGDVVSYGEAEAKPFDTLWAQLVLRSLTFTRFHLGHVDFTSEIWRRGVETVFGGVANGTIQVPIEQVFAFEDAAAMYQRLESRQVAGKLVLAVDATL